MLDSSIQIAVDDMPGPFPHHGCLVGTIEVACPDVLCGIDWLCDAPCECKRVLPEQVHVDPREAAEFDALETKTAVHEREHAIEVLE